MSSIYIHNRIHPLLRVPVHGTGSERRARGEPCHIYTCSHFTYLLCYLERCEKSCFRLQQIFHGCVTFSLSVKQCAKQNHALDKNTSFIKINDHIIIIFYTQPFIMYTNHYLVAEPMQLCIDYNFFSFIFLQFYSSEYWYSPRSNNIPRET